MDLEMAYFVGFVITSLSTMVAVFVYEYTIKGDMLNEETFPVVLISLAIAMCWFVVIPAAILVGVSYAVAKLLIFCREKWRNK